MAIHVIAVVIIFALSRVGPVIGLIGIGITAVNAGVCVDTDPDDGEEKTNGVGAIVATSTVSADGGNGAGTGTVAACPIQCP